MLFTTEMLLERYSKYANPYQKIRIECDNKRLFKVFRGLYEDNPKVDRKYLAGYIVSPSYISFEYVLSKYELIPEYVPNITCASFKKNKYKSYETFFGNYLYRDIPVRAFNKGLSLVEENGYSYLIASKEKALCDKLYTIKQVLTMKEFRELLFEDLRIDKQEFAKLDREKIKEFAPLYKKNNLKLLLKLIEKEEK